MKKKCGNPLVKKLSAVLVPSHVATQERTTWTISVVVEQNCSKLSVKLKWYGHGVEQFAGRWIRSLF